MNRYFIELSYQGSAYNGWQRQNNSPSVQQEIEEALCKIIRSKTPITGCGRTDTGVHARFAVAHFESEKPAEHFDAHFVYHLNCILPKDIEIKRIYPTEFHARFDAKLREYKYYIALTKNPFCRNSSWQILTPLNIQEMQKATKYLLLHNDFTSFAKLHSDTKTNICSVTHCDVVQIEGLYENPMIVLTIRADRFLRGMVRGIVGTLADVGRGKITPTQFNDIIVAENRQRASSQAPAQGLFLTKVTY